LAQAAEAAASGPSRPLYVIGTEVPPAGGMGRGHAVVPTAAAHVARTMAVHRRAFDDQHLQDAFARVVALVVQPGVDFGNESVEHLDPNGLTALTKALGGEPRLVYEAHSTDYQRPAAYGALVAARFAILKVGPAATNALRQALFALEAMEAELADPKDRSGLGAAVEHAMLADPSWWQSHYDAEPARLRYLRRFSYSDRIRYYWTVPEVEVAQARLFANLERDLPLPLIGQYMPHLHDAVADGRLLPRPLRLCHANVQHALAPYLAATVPAHAA
jgi:D-tagatose-1,6-bisphosphate aldolase subunit GatZ/KbaZ